jgi:hypothetical protein
MPACPPRCSRQRVAYGGDRVNRGAGCGDPVRAPDCYGLVICKDCADEGRRIVDELITDVQVAELLRLALAALLADLVDDD